MAQVTPTRIPQVISADFHANLTPVPGKADLARKVNEEAVKQSIRNLVLTNKGERPFQPQIGCDVRKLLFENATPMTLSAIQDVIESTITNYEPRCNLISVDVSGNIDSNELNVTIVFSLINSDNIVNFSLILNRIR